jgi:hypothetical protein
MFINIQSSDLPGPAQSREPGQAGPVRAGPGQAIGDGLATALARLRVAESQSRRLWPGLWSVCVHVFGFTLSIFLKEVLANEGHRKAWQVRVPFFKCGRVIHAVLAGTPNTTHGVCRLWYR